MLNISDRYSRDKNAYRKLYFITLALFAVCLSNFKYGMLDKIIGQKASGITTAIIFIFCFISILILARRAFKIAFYPEAYISKTNNENSDFKCEKCNKFFLSEDIRGDVCPFCDGPLSSVDEIVGAR